MGFVMMSVYLPVFHDLKLTSTYQVKFLIHLCFFELEFHSYYFQYLQMRFDSRMRIFGCILFIYSQVWFKL